MSTTTHPPDRPYVAASMLRSLLYFFEQQGLDSAHLAQRARITDDLLAERERLIAGHYYATLMQTGIDATGDALLGLRFGMAVEPDRWGMLGVLLTHCSNVAEAIAFQQRFQALVSTVGHAELAASGPDMMLHWKTPQPTLPALAEEALAAWVNFGRWATGQPQAPNRVTFRHAAQGDMSTYTEFFGCPVAFEQPRDALFFASEVLDTPLRNPDIHLRHWLTERTQRLQHELLDDDIRTRIGQWLAEQLPFGVPARRSGAAAGSDRFSAATATRPCRVPLQGMH